MRRGSIRGILIAIYLLTMVIAWILGIGIYKVTTSKERLANTYLQELETTRTCETFLELCMKQVEDSSLELALDHKVILAFEKGEIEEDMELKKKIDNWLLHNTAIQSVYLMGLEGQLLSVSNISTDQYKKDRFMGQFSKEVLSHISQKEGQSYIGIGYDYVGSSDDRTMYIARRINSLEKIEPLGYIFYFFESEALKEQLEDYLKRNKFELLIVDESGNGLNVGETAYLEEMYNRYKLGLLTDKQKEEWESTYHHPEVESKKLGVKLLGKNVLKSVDSNWINMILVLSFINLVFLFIGIIAIKSIVIEPLEQISSSARQITEDGNLSYRFNVNSSYREGTIIVHALNDMLDRINQMTKESKERERQKRVLELSVINHQVNPHFLFNTLNSVSLLIAVEDKKTALKLVKGLAKYYRACLSQENNVNTIEQELVIMREYVHIVELKNPQLIRLKIEVDENVYSKKIPRMILQTLVENSIKYGVKTMDEPLEIQMRIKADESKKRTILMIRDNGKGMEDEIKQSILQGMALKDKSGFGIKSTIKRISLMYQIENVNDIIEIDSVLNEYTCIKFYIPWES